MTGGVSLRCVKVAGNGSAMGDEGWGMGRAMLEDSGVSRDGMVRMVGVGECIKFLGLRS